VVAEFDWSVLFSNPFGWLSVAVVAGVIGSIAGSIATNWRKVRESEHAISLKQSMIDRGMSADEIERVLNAGRTTKST
jgi:CheY-specific phosphatase CheX